MYVGDLNNGLTLPISLVYTYTESEFQTSFESDFPRFGIVNEGDELTYLPEHQGRLQIGLAHTDWSLDVAVNYISEMREEPGQGDFEEGKFTEAYTTVDLAGAYWLRPDLQIKLIGENLTDEQEIVSRRPFGARPNQPRMVKAGVVYQF